MNRDWPWQDERVVMSCVCNKVHESNNNLECHTTTADDYKYTDTDVIVHIKQELDRFISVYSL